MIIIANSSKLLSFARLTKPRRFTAYQKKKITGKKITWKLVWVVDEHCSPNAVAKIWNRHDLLIYSNYIPMHIDKWNFCRAINLRSVQMHVRCRPVSGIIQFRQICIASGTNSYVQINSCLCIVYVCVCVCLCRAICKQRTSIWIRKS